MSPEDIRHDSVLPARREDIELNTADGLTLVGELTVNSPEFAKLWADHRIQPCDISEYEMRHPLVGTLTVTQQTLQSPTKPDQYIVVATAQPGSPSQHALDLLTQATAPLKSHQPS